MIERADTLAGPWCLYTSRGDRFDSQLGNVELYRPESAGRRVLLSVVSSGTAAFDSRILHRKGATCARGGVFKFRHVVNNDTIMHAVHTCTFAFSPQS